MKKSVLTVLTELKEVLDEGETAVLELQIAKGTYKFTITKDQVKSTYKGGTND